jgi:hypothetical protein
MHASAELRGILDRVALRFRRVRLWGGLAACWAALAVIGLVSGAFLAAGESAGTARLVALGVAAAALALGLAWWAMSWRTARDPRWVARRPRVAARHGEIPRVGAG